MAKKQRKRHRIGAIGKKLTLPALGAVVMYFFDRDRGRARRATVRDRTAALARRSKDKADRKVRYWEGKREGLAHSLAPSPTPDHNDVTLQHKIESEVLRNFPKGSVNVNVEYGEAVLRGILDRPEDINALVKAVRAVPGVTDVRNMLHLPGTPAPNWEPAQRQRSSR